MKNVGEGIGCFFALVGFGLFILVFAIAANLNNILALKGCH